jgi:hypothetical protein
MVDLSYRWPTVEEVAEELHLDAEVEYTRRIAYWKAIARSAQRFVVGLAILSGTALLLSMALQSAPVIASHFAGQAR